jgi:hypothetical protein
MPIKSAGSTASKDSPPARCEAEWQLEATHVEDVRIGLTST